MSSHAISTIQRESSPSSPVSSTSTSIAVGSTPEEELYAVTGHDFSRRHTGDAADNASTAAAGQPSDELMGADFTGTGMEHYPASLTESIRHHVYQGGLRYHAYRDGRYAFPNDEVEQNRDDMKHTMTLLLCRQKHFYAPVEQALMNGGKVLDLGTGTGIWCTEMGDKYVGAEIIGLDLSAIQPEYVPENVHFFVDDFEEEWVDADNTYDFIHIRHTIHSVRNLELLLQRAYSHLKPGGYLEVQELHYSPHCDDASVTPEIPYAFRDFMGFLDEGLRSMGCELNAIVHMPDDMRRVGFEEVQVVQHKCPIGVWPKEHRLRLCGLFLRTAIMDGLKGLSTRPFGTGLGWTPLQIEMFLIEVRKHVMDSSFHTYFPFHVVYGRKPLN